jgi:uncharacterized RDD family membrane protein YckC
VAATTLTVDGSAIAVLAPMSRRMVGALIDQVVVLVPITAVALALGAAHHLSRGSLLVANVALLAVAFVYETAMIGSLGRTVGKIAMGTRVVSVVDGERPRWSAAAQRSLLPLLCGTVPSVGLLLGVVVYGLAIVHPRRQGLHDRAAGTLVVLSEPVAVAR